MTSLLFFAGFWEPFWMIACGFAFLFFTTCSFGEMFGYVLYFTLFSKIGTFYIYMLLSAFLIVVVKYIIDLVKKREKFFAVPFVLTTVFVLVFSLINYEFAYSGVEQGGLIIALLYVCYFAFVYRKQINVRRCFELIMMGIVISGLLGATSLLFDGFNYSIIHNDRIYKRLMLFCYHQNHLAMVCAFAISYFIYLIVNKKAKWYIESVYIAICLIVGLLTLSKAFMLMCVGFVGYLCIYLIAKYKWKSLKVIVPVFAIMAVFCLVCYDFVGNVFERFLAYNTKSSLINRITTGRSAIWYEYINTITSSIPTMLFGFGLFNSELILIGAHNVLIFFAYRVGVLGLMALGLLCYSYFKASETKIKITYKNMLLFLTFIILSFNEMIFSDRFAFFLILGVILMIPEKKEESKEADLEKVENEQN